MSKYDKLLLQILLGLPMLTSHLMTCDICLQAWVSRRGFEAVTIMFRRAGIVEKINLQREGNKAKIYQVRQVRAVIVKYKLGGEV
jgi:hypothetical protein